MITKWIVLFAIALTCDGQLQDYLLPQMRKIKQNVADTLKNTPLIRFTPKPSDSVTMTASFIPSVLSTLARAFSVVNSQPGSFNDIKDDGTFDKYITDYNIGLRNEDVHLHISSIIPKYGYPFEKHEVVTPDGYILSLYRIPGNGSVVFLMHGLLGSADDYIVTGPENGLAYLLASEGYEVWMGNARGNKHSRRHVRLTPDNPSFWDFSWHEIGSIDLPAMIDYALEKTNQKSLKYIGHSQGTTSFFVMASERPEYNKKVSLMIALSPVAFMSNLKSPIVRMLAPSTSLLYRVAKVLGMHEFMPNDNAMRTMKAEMCGNGALGQIICSNVIFLIAGFNYQQLNFKTLPVILGHTPSGSSFKQFAHYGQGVNSGDFRKFDYGSYGNYGNYAKYGRAVPPSYSLDKITAPVSLFYSDNDWLAHTYDVNKLYNRLPNTVDVYKIPHDKFNHLDFLFAKDFKDLVYQRIKKIMKLI